MTLEERFWSKVNKNGPVPPHKPELGPCWVWAGSLRSNGYGQLWYQPNGRPEGAHRIALLIETGHLPEEDSLHACDNRTCVKAMADELWPAHVTEGPRLENVRDMVAKGRNSAAVHPDQVLRGARHPRARLTVEQVVDFRRRHAAGEASLMRLAAEGGVTRQAVWLLLRGRNWKSVTDGLP